MCSAHISLELLSASCLLLQDDLLLRPTLSEPQGVRFGSQPAGLRLPFVRARLCPPTLLCVIPRRITPSAQVFFCRPGVLSRPRTPLRGVPAPHRCLEHRCAAAPPTVQLLVLKAAKEDPESPQLPATLPTRPCMPRCFLLPTHFFFMVHMRSSASPLECLAM
eukprot:EG_transcript_19876